MRAWQVPAGIVTTLLIALFFDELTKGVYVTLLSLIGLQTLADSGLLNVILHAVSHEWAGLRLDRQGFLRGSAKSRSRIAGMVRFAIVWFSVCAVVLVAGGIAFGIHLFAGQGVVDQVVYPLIIAMIFVGCSIGIAPLIATLEGCNQVSEVNRFRLMQAITGSVIVWSCLVGGASLWTPVAAVLVQLFWEAYLLFGRYRRLMCQLWRTPAAGFDWRQEIWPLQWRIGIQSVVRYFALFPMIPALFAWQGPEVAGRVGMTWGILNSLLLIAYAWVRTRAPEFGQLIAAGKRTESNASLVKAIVGSTTVLVLALTTFLLTLAVLREINFEFAQKISVTFLSPEVAVWFALGLIPLHLTQCLSFHLRARKMDPIWRISIIGNLVLGAAIVLSARYRGAQTVGVTMFVTFSTVMSAIYWMWLKYDRYYAELETKDTSGNA
jgi:hypothetical protein